MADIVHVASNTGAGQGPNNALATVPAVEEGDLILVSLSCSSELLPDGSTAPPDGYALVTTETHSNSASYALYYKIADGTEDGDTIDSWASAGAGMKFTVAVSVFRNVSTSSPIQDVSSSNPSTSGTTATMPSVTTELDNCFLIAVAATKGSTTPTGSSVSGASTLAERYETTSGSMKLLVASAGIVDAGTYGAVTYTTSHSVSQRGLFTLALAPAVTTETVHPDSDVTTTGWTATPSSSPMADNLADGLDSSYIESDEDPSSRVYECGLGTPGAPLTSMSTRVAVFNGTGTFTTELVYGTTVVATRTDDLPDEPTTFTYTLTSTEQDDQEGHLSDLRIRTTVSAS